MIRKNEATLKDHGKDIPVSNKIVEDSNKWDAIMTLLIGIKENTRCKNGPKHQEVKSQHLVQKDLIL